MICTKGKRVKKLKEEYRTSNFYRIRRRNELKRYFDKMKLEKGCYICGYNKCAKALHWHHRNPKVKVKVISKMISAPMSFEKILKEVEKCNIICANCHAELHGGVKV